jgi:endonuclease YncB( thermonuclease family)
MRNKLVIAFLAALLILATSLVTVFAGDSVYGKVTEVKSAEVVVLDYGKGSYNVRLVGIVAPKEGPLASAAKDFVARLVLGKNARMRFEGRNEAGEMVSKLTTDDPEIGIKDVGLELVRNGLAQRQPKFDYQYGEMSRAENEAKKNRRGIWARQRR